jgi:hypothetical protein
MHGQNHIKFLVSLSFNTTVQQTGQGYKSPAFLRTWNGEITDIRKKKIASESARLVSATWRRPQKYRNQITDATLTQRSMQKQLTRVTLK